MSLGAVAVKCLLGAVADIKDWGYTIQPAPTQPPFLVLWLHHTGV